MERGKGAQYLVAFSVSLATLTMGASSAWPTIVLPRFKGNESSIQVTDDVVSWMVAVSPLGFLSGSLVTRYISDNFGRRATVLGSAAPFTLGTMFVIYAAYGWMLCITKFLWGFGTGMLSTVITMYLIEISYKELRGSLNVFTRFTFNFGNLLVMCVGPFLSYSVLNYSLLPLPVIFFLACWWIPESPYYHLKEGRVDAAREELAKLRNSDDIALEEELQIIQDGVKNEMRSSSSAKELFNGRQYRKAVVIAVGLKMTQILTGGMAIQQYLIIIVQESKFKMAPATIAIVFGAVKFGVSLISSILVDRIGRRPLIIHSLVGTGVSYFIVGSYFFFLEVVRIEHESLSPYGILTFIGILFSTIISTLGFNSVIGIVPAEIFPMNVKAVAMSSLNILGGLLGFVVGKGYKYMKDLLGLTGVFWIFAFVTFSGAVFTHFFVPETRNKSLYDIQILLQGDLYIENVNKKNDLVSDEETELTELNGINDVKNKI
ncbi:PREDICTED: facilitated trehalose transporter Tret1-like [Papilio polytes]|uniref:facilitated trehalose transporter Tret1-like n=1 Tax=Papilio polytes TaxID=76194 RepID=UPI0006764E69|nr:PREDICTED: facilitated trehalose transporter Tret1-like [Papilio polytes]XP_013143574.1 PREDICTED: facilitated trehalose transporter Tret1-like [Papilio polytes]XP_013143575.1 PREDICTED: facilitated trehalose transporter Tret1-like [Papilio polytes]